MKTNSDPLFLHEEILLLALRDREGTVPFGSMYEYALGGALLAELLLRGRVRLDPLKKGLVELVSAEPVGDPLLDEALQIISEAKRRRALQSWVSKFAGLNQLKHRLAGQLCQRGILRADNDQVLGIFHRKIYPEINAEPEKQLLERIRGAILSDTLDLDPRTITLVALAHHSGLLRLNLSKAELKSRKARIAQIINGDVAGKAVKEVIESVEASIAVAAILPAIASS